MTAVGAASPVPAAADVPLSYRLMVTGDTYSGVHPSGSIAGTLGGVAVDGTYSGGAWTLSVYGRPFATGTYECVHICRFDGTMLAGRALIYTWTSQVPTWDARAQLSASSIARLFNSRDEWSARVGAWARSNNVPAGLQTRLTVDARTGM
jgi:hypothetical protein